MRILVDAQLPPALARKLIDLGQAVEHVADCGLIRATDSAIRAYAAATEAVIMTKDEDFAVYQILHDGPSVVWLRIGNTRRAALLRRIEAEYETIVAAIERGETLIEII
ncbi:MAG: DUF5615 family PIN-like protein [Vicinamibacterales bacterium]